MRAIHLNYHEITEDPRVLKECTALSERGVDVTVLCALHPGFPEREQVGSLDVHRVSWMDRSKLDAEYLENVSEFPRSKELVLQRLQPLLPADKEARDCVEEHVRVADFELDPNSAYRNHRGLKRFAAKRAYRRNLKSMVATIERELQQKDMASAFESRDQLQREIMDWHSSKKVSTVKHNDVYQASAFLFDLNARALEFEESFDIVHAHDIYTLVAGVRLAAEMNAKLIYDAHEYEPERASKMPPEGNQLADSIELDCLERTDALVTVSPGICDLYAKRFSTRAPTLIMNAPEIHSKLPDEDTLNARKKAFRERLGLNQDTPLLVFTGLVLGEQRGLSQVVVALRSLTDYHLAILGPRQEHNDAKLLEMAKACGVQDRIHLLEPVAHSEVVPTIRACDVAIVPFQDAGLSYRYAMPNKLFEGIFAGLPVAVADLPDMKAFVEGQGRGIAMDSTDPDNIAETVVTLYNDRKNYKLDSEAFDNLVRNYSWSAQATRLHELYQSLDAN